MQRLTVLALMKRAKLIHPKSKVKKSFLSKEKAVVKPTHEMSSYPGVSNKVLEVQCDEHDSIYLCGRCSLKITEEYIVDHVTDVNHQKLRRVAVKLSEKTYNKISKEGFYSAIDILKALNLHRNNVKKRASTSTSARPVNTSAARDSQHVRSMMDAEMDRPKGSRTVIHIPGRNSFEAPSSSKEAQSKTVKVSKPAGGTHAPQFKSCGKQTLKGSRVDPSLLYPRRNGSKDVAPNIISKWATTPQIKRSAAESTSMPTASKYARTSSTVTGTTPTSSRKFSKMPSSSKSVPVSRVLEGESGAAEAKPAARSARMHEATCSTDPSSRNRTAQRCVETTPKSTFQTKRKSGATPKGLKLGFDMVCASKTAKMKNSCTENDNGGPYTDERNPATALHLKTTSSTASELKKHHKEHIFKSSGTKGESHPKVGLNQLIIVSWEGKQQVYCQLCSVRLKRSDHPLTFDHRYNYVKMKYPGWTATPEELEQKLNNIVAHLAEVEKNLGSQNVQRVEVKKDIYQSLALLPEDKAVEKVKAMVKLRDPMSSPEHSVQVGRRDVASPCEVSSSNDEVLGAPAPSSEVPGFSVKSRQTQETKTERQKLLDQITEMKSRLETENDLALYQSIRGQSLHGDLTHVADLTKDQLCSSVTSNKRRPLPILAPSTQPQVMAENVKQELLEPDGDVQPNRGMPVVTSTPGKCKETVKQELLEHDRDVQTHKEIPLVIHTPVKQKLLDPDRDIPSRREIPLVIYTPETVKQEQLVPDRDVKTRREVPVMTCGPETVKQESLEPDRDGPSHRESPIVTHAPAKVNHHSEHLVNSDHIKTEMSDPASWEAKEDVKSEQQLTPYQMNSPKQKAATASAEQLYPTGPSHSAGPREPDPPQAFTVTSAGRKIQGCSHLSIFLKAIQQEARPIIGMGLVWECRGMSLETFFLCESCEKTLTCRDICQHMTSSDHQLKFIWREYPQFLRLFWDDQMLQCNDKMDIVQDIVKELSKRERFYKVDVQCVLLGKELHQFVKTSSFHEALEMVHRIKDEEKPTIVCLPMSTTHQSSQQPESCHKLLKGQTAQTVGTDQRCYSAIQKKETSQMCAVRGSEVKQVLNHTDANSVKAELASPVPIVGTCLAPQETCGGPCLQPEFKPAVSLPQKSDPLRHVNKAFKSTSLGSTISQYPEVCPKNEVSPSRKRPADKSEDPSPSKRISNPVQVKGEPCSPSVYPDVNSTSLSMKHQYTQSNTAEPAVDWKLYSDLISELKKSNFQVRKSPESIPDTLINPCGGSSSKAVASRWDSKMQRPKSEAAMNQRRWDSKCLLLKGMKTEAPVDLKDEN